MKIDKDFKIKSQDSIKCKLCEVALVQPKPEKYKDPDWYSETNNYHFEVMRQMNDMTNKLKEEGVI